MRRAALIVIADLSLPLLRVVCRVSLHESSRRSGWQYMQSMSPLRRCQARGTWGLGIVGVDIWVCVRVCAHGSE
jgi:hypothetical protein